MQYFKKYECEQKNLYSVDKIIQVFKYQIRSGLVDSQKILDWLSMQNEIEYDDWVTTKLFMYHWNFRIKCANGESFFIGFALNNAKPDGYKFAKIEYNPNKVRNAPEFKAVFNRMVSFAYKSELKKFDLAIDIPIERSRCELLHDRRTYQEHCNSESDRTQYLGQRSNHGFVKLYNKQQESKLGYPLTRLELTIDYEKSSFDEVQTIIPSILVLPDTQLDFEFLKLTQTDKFILEAIFDKPERIKGLSRNKREKVNDILARYHQPFVFSAKTYANILALLNELCNIVL